MGEFYAGLERLHMTPLFAGYRLVDLLSRGLISRFLSGYNAALHQSVVAQVETLFDPSFSVLEAAAAEADGIRVTDRVAAVRSNLARQKAQALVVVHCTALLEYLRKAREAKPETKDHWLERATGMLQIADGVHTAWEHHEKPLLPDWYVGKHKEDAYRAFIEEKRAELVQLQCSAT